MDLCVNFVMDTESIHEKLRDFEDACRRANLKITHQRLEIFRELAKAIDHPSAETLYKRLQEKLPTLSLDTVYRTLATFEDNGLISRVETVKSQARFEAEMSEHHHLICSKCGKITDFEWTSFRGVDLPDEISHWGSINKKNVILRGICNQCSSAEQV
jgi:Fur family transcriptional regulator, peroxide stress response regulator